MAIVAVSVATEGDTTRGEGSRREQVDELALLVRPERLERKLVRIEWALRWLHELRWARVGGGAIELRERDMLFVDGHARFLDCCRCGPDTRHHTVMIATAAYRGMVRMD
jgi:prepilin-type processing-associated H-X9-DG protein